MSYIGTKDFALEVAKGNVASHSKINKFGAATDCDLNTDTDIWDGADGTTSTDIWVAPTTARTHNIASTSASDDGDPAGVGMRTVRIYGLTSWSDTEETTEDVTLNGTSNVATSNSYVIIHRMQHLTSGASGPNVGIITATAQTDGTVTAAIQAGEGQTLMAIYGVPSQTTLHVTEMYSTVLRSVSTARADMTLLWRDLTTPATSAWVTKERQTMTSDAPLDRRYRIPKSFSGPGILKMQVNTSANDCTVTGSFDGYVVSTA